MKQGESMKLSEARHLVTVRRDGDYATAECMCGWALERVSLYHADNAKTHHYAVIQSQIDAEVADAATV
jgi:hypothetical protein